MDNFFAFVVNHWALWTALVILLVFILLNEMKMQQGAGKSVSPQQAVSLINHENAVVIDLRNNEMYKKGHIVDSLQESAQEISNKKLGKYKNKPIILACSNGIQSAQVAKNLKTQGQENVLSLKGGITAWTSAGLPLVNGK